LFNFLQIRIRHEIKIGNNDYVPGRFDYTFNVCEMATGLKTPFLNVIFSGKAFDDLIHACPYNAVNCDLTEFVFVCVQHSFLQNESIMMTNVTVASNNIPALGQGTHYRMTFYLISGKYLEVFSVVTTGVRCVKD
jgi:hypothetical protein